MAKSKYIQANKEWLAAKAKEDGVKVLEGQQLLDLMEIIEDRHGRNSTIIVSQLSVANWYDILNGNTTAANAILDRIVHTSKRFTLSGSSLRKK